MKDFSKDTLIIRDSDNNKVAVIKDIIFKGKQN